MIRQHKWSTSHCRLKMAQLYRNLRPCQFRNHMSVCLSKTIFQCCAVFVYCSHICRFIASEDFRFFCFVTLPTFLFPLHFGSSYFSFRRPGCLLSATCNVCPYSFYMLFSIYKYVVFHPF